MTTPRLVSAALVAGLLAAAVSAAAVQEQSPDVPPARRTSPRPGAAPRAASRTTSPSPAEASARAELEDLRAALESAVGRTRHPAPLGPAAAGRVYVLHDYGAMIVLAPRTLATRRVVVRHVPRPSPVPPAVAVPMPVDPFEMVLDLSDIQRELERQMAAQAMAVGETEAQRDWTRAREDEVRRYVRLVEEQAEAFRAEAERARQQAEREVRTRLAPLPPPAVPSPENAISADPASEAPTVSPTVSAALVMPPVPPVPPVAPVAEPESPEPPEPPDALDVPPPWRFWFAPGLEVEAGPGGTDPDDVDAAVSAVRESLASGLASYRRPLSALAAEESVAVAVDFVADRILRTPPVRTLLVRVRAGDLRDRQAGRITLTEFRRRLDFGEN
jgi:hypothetical protein